MLLDRSKDKGRGAGSLKERRFESLAVASRPLQLNRRLRGGRFGKRPSLLSDRRDLSIAFLQ